MSEKRENKSEDGKSSPAILANRKQPKVDPEYLLSQSTFTAITLLSGTGPDDATIGLAKCTGKPEQQWLRAGNVLLMASNPSYCIVPDFSDRTLRLGDASTSTDEWIYDEEDRFVVKGRVDAMDVPYGKPRTNITLYPKHDGIHQKWWPSSELDSLLDGAPPAEYPVSINDEKIYMQELARTLENQAAPVTEPLPYERDVATFPGLVSPDAPRVTQTILLDLLQLGQASDLRMTVPQDWQATHLYLVADELVEVVLPDTLSTERAAQIQVRVSAHVDFLQQSSANVIAKGEWMRMPIVTETFDLAPGVNKMRSQYGGHLIFTFSEGDNFTVEAEIKNVVEAPYFRLGETTQAQWEEELNKGTPYTLLETDMVVAVVARADAQGVTDPDTLMNRYDEVISMLNYAAGFDETEPPPRGKFWLVNDMQITAGSAHAGFPAMFDRTYYNMASGDTPYDWVSWHELGHNYQQMKYWAGAYGSESTVNLYSLYIQRQLFEQDRLEIQGDYDRAADDVDGGMSFEEADVWEKLVFLMEIKWAFPDQDWDMFRQLRRITRALSAEEAKTLEYDTQLQFDHAYKNLSKIVGSDLINTYNRWSLPISQAAQEEVSALGLPKAPGDLSHRTAKKKN